MYFYVFLFMYPKRSDFLTNSLSSSTSASVTWSVMRAATATRHQSGSSTPAARPAARGRDVAKGMECVVPAIAVATVRI